MLPPDIDAIELELTRNLLEAAAGEMGITLQRVAFSANIKERRDFSCAIFDAAGDLLAQAAHIPVHLGSMPASGAAAAGTSSDMAGRCSTTRNRSWRQASRRSPTAIGDSKMRWTTTAPAAVRSQSARRSRSPAIARSSIFATPLRKRPAASTAR